MTPMSYDDLPLFAALAAPDMPQATVICDDVLAWAERYTGEPFYACLMDGPYGLGFMGKKWDRPATFFERKAERSNGWDHVGGNHNPVNAQDAARTYHTENERLQGWYTQVFKALAQHLLPGAFLMAFGGARTYHRLACAMEDAGLIIHPALGFLQGQGFPKATRVQDERFDGHRYGMQAMKPAIEFIAFAQVPYGGSARSSITQTGAGTLNIDGARLATPDTLGRVNNGLCAMSRKAYERGYRPHDYDENGQPHDVDSSDGQGRWPANVALCHVSLPVLRLKGHLANDTQAAIRQYYAGYTGVSALRDPRPGAIEVLARDVPDSWLDYFELTGDDLGCVRVGARQVKGSHPIGPHPGTLGYHGSKRSSPSDDDTDATGHETVAAWQCAPGCPVHALDAQAGDRPGGGGLKPYTRANRGGYTGPMPETSQTTWPSDPGGGYASRFFMTADWSLDVAERLAQADPVFYCGKASSSERSKGLDGMMKLRDDLTEDELAYVMRELKAAGVEI